MVDILEIFGNNGNLLSRFSHRLSKNFQTLAVTTLTGKRAEPSGSKLPPPLNHKR